MAVALCLHRENSKQNKKEMKKQKLRKYTESMKELNLQEQKEIEGGYWVNTQTPNGEVRVIWVES